jgi:hypothetical protein
MKLDFDLDLPFDASPPLPEQRMNADRYLEFIEFNRQIIIENGTAEKLINQRSRPVEKMFSLD